MTVTVHDRGGLNAEGHEVCRECWEEWPCPDVVMASVGTCQVCGRITADLICYATKHCREVGGGEVS